MNNGIRRLLALAIAPLLGACSMLPDRAWIPQAPGGATSEAQQQTQAQTQPPAAQRPSAQQAPARRFDVEPDLVAQSPLPPSRREPASGQRPPLPLGGYTQATRYGDLLFISGQIALDLRTNQMHGTTIEEQTRQVMENIRVVLESHRLTMANVVSTTVYLKDLKDFPGMDRIYESYFRTALPSRSVIEAGRLPRNALVEISAVAGR